MSFDDYLKHFDKMEICNLGPDVMDEIYQMTGIAVEDAGYRRWNTRTHLGVWSGETAGGCRNFLGMKFIEGLSIAPRWEFPPDRT